MRLDDTIQLGRSVALGFVVWLTAGGESRTAAAAGRHGEFATKTIKVGNAVRQYRLVVPRTVALAKPAPLVVAFHGFLIDSKDLMPKYTKLNATAKKHRFELAYPEAIDRAWGLAPAKIRADLAFFDALVKRICTDYRIDRKRIYVVGMSNGGYFAHLVGKERSKRVAAVASHSGPLGLQTLHGIGAQRKFPVLILHGKNDPLFPIKVARDNRDSYRREGHPVKYVEIDGLGHAWGSGADVNETIWTFFKRHPLARR